MQKKGSNICCIYQIMSPSGKIYIGQTRNLRLRKTKYKNGISYKRQQKLNNSFKKYGFDNHTFKIVWELPLDINQEILDKMEQSTMDYYRDWGVELMNLKEAGSVGKMSKEVCEKIGNAHRGKIIPEEQVKKWLENPSIKALQTPILQYDLEGNFIKEWETLSLAAKTLKINKANISSVCRKRIVKNKHRPNPYMITNAGGFTWKYKMKTI